MPTDETPRQKKQALYPVNCGAEERKAVKKIGANNFEQFWVRHLPWFSIENQYPFYIRMAQAFEEDTFPDHAGCASYNCSDFHE